MTTYFKNIASFGDLKKQYRDLVKANHPDRGGNTKVMQEINKEYFALFEVWKDRKDTTGNAYTNECKGATAREYADFVYNEYRWTGKNYNRDLSSNDLGKIFRDWAKKTYPNCKFSITQSSGSYFSAYHINLYQADFMPFVDAAETGIQLNHYNVQRDERLTDRAKEVMQNVIDFIQSYNYDNSNSQIDYFDVNFYTHFEIGSYNRKFKYMPIALHGEKKTPREKIGATQRAINNALRGCKWVLSPAGYDKLKGLTVLCTNDDADSPYAFYSNRREKLAREKFNKLLAVGILAHFEGLNIIFDGLRPEISAAIEKEQQELNRPQTEKEAAPVEPVAEVAHVERLEVVEYSEKAIAVFGDTISVKDDLKNLGGRFNPRLKHNGITRAGWIFSRSRAAAVAAFIAAAAPMAAAPAPAEPVTTVTSVTAAPAPAEPVTAATTNDTTNDHDGGTASPYTDKNVYTRAYDVREKSPIFIKDGVIYCDDGSTAPAFNFRLNLEFKNDSGKAIYLHVVFNGNANQLQQLINMQYPEADKSGYYCTNFVVLDTALKDIATLKDRALPGLYFLDDNGDKITPTCIYFGCDTRWFRPDDGNINGFAYCHYNNALRFVYLPDGTRFADHQLCNVCARYKDGVICEYYRE